MQTQRFVFVRAAGAFFLASACLACASWAQAPAAPPPPRFSATLPVGATVKGANEVLATLRPPASVDALAPGNDLLMQFPDVAAAGGVRVKLVSGMPRTEGLWLFSLSPQPEGGVALLASVGLGGAALPEATLLLDLSQTQTLLLVARSGGKYYGLQREIKIGQSTQPRRKP